MKGFMDEVRKGVDKFFATHPSFEEVDNAVNVLESLIHENVGSLAEIPLVIARDMVLARRNSYDEL